MRDKLRFVIAESGIRMGRKRTKYLHTGWRKINGKWSYLYHGGAVGGDVDVELPENLRRYVLQDPSSEMITEIEAAAATMELRNYLPGRIYYPAMAMVALAPLQSILYAAGSPVRTLLFLHGRTGSGKSIVATMALAFFSTYQRDEFPASFSSSTNYVRKCSFALKDSLLVVDDYKPSTNAMAKKKQDQMVEDIAQMFGSSERRDILNANSDIKASTPPRSLCIVTGEMIPDAREGALHRCYSVRVGDTDVPKNDDLTELQRKGSKGYFRRFMKGYLEWLRPQLDTIGERMADRFVEYRARAQHEIKNGHARTPGNVAYIMLGVEMFLRYQYHALGMGDDQTLLHNTMEQAWHDVLENTKSQM